MTRKSSKNRPPDEDYFGENDPPKTKRTDGWPDDVPILVADDMVWNWTSDDGRKDLAVWLESTFNPEFPVIDLPQYAEAYRTLCAVITERFGKQVTKLGMFLEYAKKNKRPSLAWQAACWNAMLQQLGYEVPKQAAKDPGYADKE